MAARLGPGGFAREPNAQSDSAFWLAPPPLGPGPGACPLRPISTKPGLRDGKVLVAVFSVSQIGVVPRIAKGEGRRSRWQGMSVWLPPRRHPAPDRPIQAHRGPAEPISPFPMHCVIEWSDMAPRVSGERGWPGSGPGPREGFGFEPDKGSRAHLHPPPPPPLPALLQGEPPIHYHIRRGHAGQAGLDQPGQRGGPCCPGHSPDVPALAYRPDLLRPPRRPGRTGRPHQRRPAVRAVRIQR